MFQERFKNHDEAFVGKRPIDLNFDQPGRSAGSHLAPCAIVSPMSETFCHPKKPLFGTAILPGGHGSHGAIARFTLEDFRRAREFTSHLLIASSVLQYNDTKNS